MQFSSSNVSYTAIHNVLTLKKDMILILTAGNKHFGLALCSAYTKTMYFHASCEKGDSSIKDDGTFSKKAF